MPHSEGYEQKVVAFILHSAFPNLILSSRRFAASAFTPNLKLCEIPSTFGPFVFHLSWRTIIVRTMLARRLRTSRNVGLYRLIQTNGGGQRQKGFS